MMGAGATACASAGGTARAPACDTPGVTADEIRLGFVFPDAGTLSTVLSPTRSGLDARIALANAAGGIHGRKIVYEWRDDAGNPERNHTAVRDLVENRNVFGVIEASTVASGGAEYLHARSIPVAGMPAESIWADARYQNMFAYSYIFTNGPSVDTFGRYVRAQGGTRAAIVGSDVSTATNDINTKIQPSLVASGVQILPGPFIFNPKVTNV
jgi:ABC-type branched-subunit amino acid transport system substrate-binding protein